MEHSEVRQEPLNPCIKCPAGEMQWVRETHQMDHKLLGPINEVLAKCDSCGVIRYFCREAQYES